MDRIVSENYSCQRRRQKGSKKPLFGTCQVCGDKAPHQQHYGCKAEVCYSCRAFFRRCVKKNIIPVKIQCNSFLIKAGTCQIKPETRSVCRYVNYQKTGGKYISSKYWLECKQTFTIFFTVFQLLSISKMLYHWSQQKLCHD